MKKISIHSFIFFIYLILKPWKNFHDRVLYYFICYKANLKHYKKPIKKELIFRYAKIEEDLKTKFKYIVFPFRKLDYKETKELLITIFITAPELTLKYFDKEFITKDDTYQLRSEFFDNYKDYSNETVKYNNITINNQLNNILSVQSNQQEFNFLQSRLSLLDIKLNQVLEEINVISKLIRDSFKNNVNSTKAISQNEKESISKESILKYTLDWIKRKNLKIKEIIIIGAILFHLDIIMVNIDEDDTIENRLKAWGEILNIKLAYYNRISLVVDEKLPTTDLKREKKFIIRVIAFFTEIGYTKDINVLKIFINDIEKELERRKLN